MLWGTTFDNIQTTYVRFTDMKTHWISLYASLRWLWLAVLTSQCSQHNAVVVCIAL